MTEDVHAFLATLDPQRRAEAYSLIGLFSDVTGYAPVLWPGKIIGFGRYAYRYESGHAGVSLATGFSPRKAELSLYVNGADPALLERLGKHRAGKGCLYLRRLSDADPAVLKELIALGLQDLLSRWTVTADQGCNWTNPRRRDRENLLSGERP
ncbi:DUF1801 domain-containing protein [Stagnihabitans tardus]|uniref:DUF1801 domain-containing protein n=1 Tax=Stagnihabitans tardus TaxID=2699202 RepID=A0AAE4YEL2_9RHOB|nr:DUF1801 domain-containing protein [Stagnihabitans tardus]NBZ88480.1 DUF1801 domain-containing protein [Stagnihabitans tardus]